MRRTAVAFAAVILVISVVFSLTSCSRGRVLEYCELSITLPSELREIRDKEELSSLLADAAATDGELTVTLARLSFLAALEDGIPDTLGPEAFARVFAVRSGLKLYGDPTASGGDITVQISDYGDAVYYTYGYSDSESGTPMRAVNAFYRTPYSYFVISFTAPYWGEWTLEEMLATTSSVTVRV